MTAIVAMCEFGGFFAMVMGIIFCTILPWYGGICIAIGIVVCLIPVFIFLFNRSKLNKFNDWLKSVGFTPSQTLGGLTVLGNKNKNGLVVDTYHKKWCKNLCYTVYDFSEILDVDIHKNGASMTQSVGAMTGKVTAHRGVFHPHAHITGVNATTSTSKDTSTYEAFIETKNMNASLIVIPCGTVYNKAQAIASLIKNNILPAIQVKTINKDITDAGDQKENLEDEIQKYKKLLENEVITEEDFEQKKKQLLGL